MKQFNAKMEAADRKYIRDRKARVLDMNAATRGDKTALENYLRQFDRKR